MATIYHPYNIALTDGQKKKLQKAFAERSAVTLRVKPKLINHGDDLLLTSTLMNRIKKKRAASEMELITG